MRRFFFLIIIFFPVFAFSQDLLILRNGKELNCKITKVDSLSIFYSFLKEGRTINSFVGKSEIRSYLLNSKLNEMENSEVEYESGMNEMIMVDTSKYIRDSYSWINLLTFSRQYGTHATGWSFQYYGYSFSSRKWMIPCIIGFESYSIKSDYFEKSHYKAMKTDYLLIGISPFRRFDDYFYVNFGTRFIVGDEKLMNSFDEISAHTIYGIALSQGIYFVPKSKFGLVCSFGLYEKIMSSEVYRNDIGVKFEIGIKF